MAKSRIKIPKVTRDTIIFLGGLAGIAHETVIQEAERPTLLILFASMAGLPVFLNLDEKKKDASKEAPTDA